MFKHYECKPIVWHQKPFVFDWDIDTGEIKGADAEKIKQMADGRWRRNNSTSYSLVVGI